MPNIFRLKKPFIVFLLLSVFLLSFDLLAQETEDPSLPFDENGCLYPLETFAYNMDMERDKPVPGQSVHAYPVSPWEVQADIPAFSDVLNPREILEVSRTTGEGAEIWIWQTPYFLPDHIPDHYQFRIYSLDTDTWRTIPSAVEGENAYVRNLFVLPDGSLWGENLPLNGKNWDFPRFSKFNEVSWKFEVLERTRNFPLGKFVLDENGVMWGVTSKAIYSYGTNNYRSEKHIDIPEDIDLDVQSIALDRNGDLFFTHYDRIGDLARDTQLYKYSVDSGELAEIYLDLNPWPAFSSLLVDSNGRLWFGGVGWREPNGNFYAIHPSPVFITNMVWGAPYFRWDSPTNIMESSDGRMWFRSDNGLTWLDPEQGQWCWFTTEQSNILEDAEHTLWLVADNKLYASSISE